MPIDPDDLKIREKKKSLERHLEAQEYIEKAHEEDKANKMGQLGGKKVKHHIETDPSVINLFHSKVNPS